MSAQGGRHVTEASDMARNPVVDCHAHIFSGDMPLAKGAWIRPDYAFTAEDLLAQLDEHGIHFAIISALSISGTYNDYLIAQLRKHKRLRGTAIVPPGTDRYTLEQMREDGIVGIRLQLARSEQLDDFRSDEYRLLFRRVRDLGWHVHVAIEGQNLPPVLDALLESGVDIVIDHFGHPDPKAPLDCVGFRAIPGPAAWRDEPDGDLEGLAQQVASQLLAQVGTDRLLWGSDAPFVGYEKRVTYAGVLASFRNWVPDADHRDAIGRTALKFYFS